MDSGRQFLRTQFQKPRVRIATGVFLVLFLLFLGVFGFYYRKYGKIVDERIRRPIFNNSAKIYATPELVRVGDKWSIDEIAEELRRAGYSGDGRTGDRDAGSYSLRGSSIDVTPGPESYHTPETSTITVDNGKVSAISVKGERLNSYELEPQLVTGLFDSKDRSKRRLLTYNEIPKVVVDAIISIEDRRFFEHGGINIFRLAEGAAAPLLGHRRMQGGSTLTMQMARSFFLTNERRLGRKLAEILIAMNLEQRFSKEQILELYVNQVDMGRRGSFTIRGFGEGAESFFGKNISKLTLPEAALLAGIVNGPSVFSPYRHPERSTERRNVVLQAMLDNDVINRSQYIDAKSTPLKLAPMNVNANSAPYYVDMVRDKLLSEFSESDLNNTGMRVYTALDPNLQRAASEAIEIGMKQVDEQVRKLRTRRIPGAVDERGKPKTVVQDGPMPQVALIALDPHSGNVLALSGGRNYGVSQLNHAIAKRPTGSIFKPFVYAAALNTGLSGDAEHVYTQATMLDATEGTFDFNGQEYSPHNFDAKYSVGEVSARFALAHSINTATIRLAEMVGYNKVVQLARAAGLRNVRATPAMAIGAYDQTPMEMAGAYTVFANGGVRMSEQFITSVRAANGDVMQDISPAKTTVLDPRIAFLVTDMLQGVLNYGTAAAVRAKFYAPAAGKTGSSHDAWFAGYSSNLLCIVWVGNDDYSNIVIEGAHAAAPIWAEFMARAQKLRRYQAMTPFSAPSGVNQVKLDKTTNLLATISCPDDYDAYFLDGTQPTTTCDHPNGDTRNILQKMFGLDRPKPPLPPTPPTATDPVHPQEQQEAEKKKSFWRRVFGGGKHDKDQEKDKNPKPPE